MVSQCWISILLHAYGAILMLQSKSSSALISGQFYHCSESSCKNTLSNSTCVVDNHRCKCAVSNSSSLCDTLDQQFFVNSTEDPRESTSNWICCWCRQNDSYCCNKSISTAASPPITSPTLYYRVILVFMLECGQFSGNEQQFKNSLELAVASFSRNPLVHVASVSCSTLQQPYCGVHIEDIKTHHRAKRFLGADRMKAKGSSTNNNNGGNSKNTYRKPIYLTCHGVVANITVEGKNLTKLNISLGLLRHFLSNKSLVIQLWNGRSIHPSFMLSAVKGSSYSLQEQATKSQSSIPTEDAPPIEVNLKPLYFALGGIFGLVFLCVLWKLLKHSWLLYKRKFTPINSDRVDHKKIQQLQRIMEAMEENDCKSTANGKSNETHSTSLSRSGNEVDGSLAARSLAPAYAPTELHMQRTPPKLILDNDDSDMDKLSYDSGSLANMEDDDFSDILNSDDERVLRDSRSSLHLSQGIGNPGFINDDNASSIKESNRNVPSNCSDKNVSKTTSARLANGYFHSELNVTSSKERKGSVVSSDLSSNADENTTFLPVKNEKTRKQQSSQKPVKGKILLPPSNTEKNKRRSSTSSLPEERKSQRPSLTSLSPEGRKSPLPRSETKEKSSTLEDVQGEGKRKSISIADNEVRIARPKDKYKKGKKNTKALHLENELKEDDGTSRVKVMLPTTPPTRGMSVISADEDTISEKNEDKNGQLTALASSGRRKSVNGDGKDVRSPGIDSRLSAQASGRRKCLLACKEEVAILDGGKPKANERLITPPNKTVSSLMTDEEDTNYSRKKKTKKNEQAAFSESSDGENTKKRIKKLKTQKGKKKKVGDLDEMSDLEEEGPTSPEGFTSFNVKPATPEMRRSTPVTTGDTENKKKRKRRKEKEGPKMKHGDSEHSVEDVEDMIKQLNENFVSPETTRRASVAPEETERKKKKPKKGKSGRKKSDIAGMLTDREMDGYFIPSARDLKAQSLSVMPERKRTKSLVLEDMDGKLEASEEET